MDVSSLPFNKWLGLTANDGTVQVSPNAKHLNHVGTVHATVLFGVAEAASGHWLVRRFPELADGHLVVLRTAQLKYRRPGTTGPPLVGSASCDEMKAERFSQTLLTRRRSTLEISAVVKQDDQELMTATFVWFASGLAGT